MKSLILFGFLFLKVLSQFTLLNTAKSLSSYQTFASGVTYDLNFTLTRNIPSGSVLTLTFATQYRIPSSTLANCKASKVSTVAPTTTACSSIYSSGIDSYTIAFTDVYTVGGMQSFLWLKFDITNPWGQISSRIDIYIKDSTGTNTLESGTFFIDYVPSPLTGCSYKGTTSLTGQNTTHIIKFTPSKDLIAGSYLSVTIPYWFIGATLTISNIGSTSLTCTGLQNTDVASLPCSLSGSGPTTQALTINNSFSTNKSSPGQVQIQIDSLRNPWSMQPLGQIIIQIYYLNLKVSQRCNAIYSTASAPAPFKTFTFAVTTNEISVTNTGLQLLLAGNGPMFKNKTRIRIQYSTQITFTLTGSGTVFLQNTTQLTLTNVATTDKNVGGSFPLFTFSLTTPPSTRPYTVKVTSQYVSSSGTVYDINSDSKTFQNNAGAITSTSVIVTDTTINVVTDYKISFKLTNKLVAGGFLSIIFPPTLTVDPTGSCNDNVTGTSTCTINTNNLTLQVTSLIVAGTSFTVTVDKVKNAAQSLTTASFKIYTYYDALYNSLVDKLQTGLTVTMTANSMTSATVTPTSVVTYTVTSYKVDFVLKDPIYVGGYIEVEFPASVTPILNSVAISSAAFDKSTCSISQSGQIVKILNCFGSSPMTTLSSSLTLSGILNPPSTRPSATFQLRTYSSAPSLLNSISTGITVTMTTAYTLSTFTITPSSPIVHTDTKQVVDITHVVPLSVNDYLLITFEPTMVVAGSVSCTALLGLTGINCLRISQNQVKVTYTSVPSSLVLKYEINTIQNYDIAQTAIPITTTIYTSDDFLKQQSSTSITYTQAPITTFSINNDDKIILLDYSEITVTVTTSFSIDSSFDVTKTKLTVGMPTGITTETNTTCTVASGTCTIPTTSSIQVANVGRSLSSYTIVLTNIMLPLISTQSSSFTITYLYNGKKVALVSSNVVIKPYCTSPCKACSVSKTKCVNCLPAPNTLVYYNPTTFTCLAACLDGTYPDGTKTCQPCSTPCLTCLDTSKCLTCIANTWLHLQSCINPCPDKFYNSSLGTCLACQGRCDKCLTQTQCLTCLTGYYYNYNCLDASNCPTGTYADTTTNNCEPCTAPCATCSLVANNCTSCTGTYLYYANKCDTKCPDGMYPSGGSCVACVGLCATCQSATYCLSCTSNYYTNGQCVTASNCPVGTYADTPLKKCQACTSPCAACSLTATNCTTCIATYLYYDNKCVSTCPNGMYPSTSTCLTCVGLCSTCLNATYCLTCSSNYLTNGQCVTPNNCPAGTFGDSTQMKCSTCPSGCTTCTSLTNCTSCDTTFYTFYQYSCVTVCPGGTYKSGFTCQDCRSPCINCQNTSSTCLSCIGGQYLLNAGCVTSCPKGMFEDSGKCTMCKAQCADCTNGSACTQCSGALYLTVTGQCSSTCPSGYYENGLNNMCELCQSPCQQCQMTASNCTSCISSRVLYQNSCSSTTCPAQYFNVSNQCKTCSNCNNCLSADQCLNCSAGYFFFAFVCYTKCPATAPIIDLTTQSCTLCDASCLTCQVTAKNCTSCPGSQYLLNSACYTSCPSGLIQNPLKQTCDPKQLSSMFYFPGVFAVVALLMVLIYSKCQYAQTEMITALTAVVSIFCMLSWVIFFIVVYFYEASLDKQLITLISLVTVAVIGLSVLLGVCYVVYVCCGFTQDNGYSQWLQHDSSNGRVQKLICSGAIFSFIFYRLLYSRLFHRLYFTLCYSQGQQLLTTTHRLSLFSILFQLLPMVGVSFFTVYKKQLYDQTVYSALDTLALNVILIILLLIEGAKSGEEFFGEMRKKLPFKVKEETKGKYLEVDSNVSIADLDEYEVEKGKRVKTQIGIKDKEEFFRRITCVENLNKFGHLNQFIPSEEQKVKSLPQQKALRNLPQYNLAGEDQIQVMDDLFYEKQQEERMEQERKKIEEQQRKALDERLREEQQKRKIQQERGKTQEQRQKIQEERQKRQEEQRKIKEQERIIRKKKQQEARIQQQKIQQEQRLQRQRLQRLLEDQMQQQNLQCVDIVAIDRAQAKNKQKKSPLDFLSKCKTVDSKPIDPKAQKKLTDVAKKNGLNPQFMKQTFGVQKHHNPELLNAIIDKHNHVNREAVKELFSEKNNKEVLQQLFSKNSTMDAQKLKEIMNDKEGKKMIEKLMDEEKGIVSPEVAKLLLDKGGKYKPEFTKKLLSGESGADEQKLQQLLRNAETQKAKEENLKALKKIGGDSMQNTQLIESMLGSQSPLNPEQFTSVAKSLSLKALQSIFTNKSPQNTQLINKVLNNKKLPLDTLSPIFQDQELIYQLGKNLAGDDPILQSNLMNLLKNCGENTSPQKLKELLQNPTLLKKLMSGQVVDPQFLTEVLSKDSNTSFDMLQKAIDGMSQQDMKKVFQFSPQKNIDYKALSKIFQQNSNTDPQLVKQMLDPQLIQQVFTKSNPINPTMLTKLVQKGTKFDKDNIVSIYGKSTNNVFDPNRTFKGSEFAKNQGNNNNKDNNKDKKNGKDNRNNDDFDMFEEDEDVEMVVGEDGKVVAKKKLPDRSKVKNRSNGQEGNNDNGEQDDQVLQEQQVEKVVREDGKIVYKRKNRKNKTKGNVQGGNNQDLISQQDDQDQELQMIIGENGKVTFKKKTPITKKNNINHKNNQGSQENQQDQLQTIIGEDGTPLIGQDGKVVYRKKSNNNRKTKNNKGNIFDNRQQQYGQNGQLIDQQAEDHLEGMGNENGNNKGKRVNQQRNNLVTNNRINNGNLVTGQNMEYNPNDELSKQTFYNAQTEYDFKMNFNKTANQNFNLSQNGQVRKEDQRHEMIMSRTDGGMMGFLNPLKLKQGKKNNSKSIPSIKHVNPLNGKAKQKDDFQELQEKLQNLDQDSEDDENERNDQAILQEQDEDGLPIQRRRKPPVKKRKLKKVTDIRHPAQKIYLEPILAPHQVSKNFRKKKKKEQSGSATKLIMDEDNDVFDIDF